MDEKQLKDFDRHIENSMNEHAVAPPFGMWNRIAAEIEMPAAAPAPVAASWNIPTGTVLGFISGALMIGTVVTGWLLYNNLTYTGLPANAANGVSNTNNTQVVNSNTENTSNTSAATVNPVLNAEVSDMEAAVASISMPKVKAKVMKAEAIESNNTTVAAEVKDQELSLPAVNTEVGVPALKIAAAPTQDAYYFPPVDIDVPTAGEQANADEDAKNDIKKTTSSSSDQRIRFKKRRKSSWSYGRIIHVPKSKGRY